MHPGPPRTTNPTNQAEMDETVTLMTRVDGARLSEHVSPQSREGWNWNDEGLAGADEMADYDGVGDSIELWDGATYMLDKKRYLPSSRLLILFKDQCQIKKIKRIPHQ